MEHAEAPDFSTRPGIAFVAGGTGGIGAAIVRALARRGSDIVFSYRTNRDAADALADEVKQFGRRVFALRLDLGDEAATAHAVSAQAEALGGIHTLVYAAGPHVPMVHLSKVSPRRSRSSPRTGPASSPARPSASTAGTASERAGALTAAVVAVAVSVSARQPAGRMCITSWPISAGRVISSTRIWDTAAEVIGLVAPTLAR